jgi:hypothetical protein
VPCAAHRRSRWWRWRRWPQGIAVNTIAFTLLNSLALRPMPVRDASRVVRIYPVDETGQRRNLFSYPDYQSYRDQQQSFEAFVAYIPSEITLGGEAPGVEPQAGLAYAGSANHFQTLGLEPSLGRSLTLSSIGIYGMIACVVRQRTREIGIRIALGARSQEVLGLVVGAGARLIALGVVAGLAGAFITTRFLKVLLAAVDPFDPLAYAAATAFLTVTALAACYFPARRAASVDPIVALRQ